MKARDSFCANPWIHLSIQPNGDMSFCGTACAGPTRGIFKDDEGNSLNVLTHKIGTQVNLKLAREVRLALLKGEKHVECALCWMEEEKGIISRRQKVNELFKNTMTIESASRITDETGRVVLGTKIFDFDIRLANHCNLKCVMCGPRNSDSWYEDHMGLSGDNFFEDRGKKVNLVRDKNGKITDEKNEYSWNDNKIFIDSFKREIPNIKSIYFGGGEPLLSSSHIDFLENCVREKSSKNILLVYNSNITMLTERHLNLWKSFKKVFIIVSLDGVEKVNDYIRFPSIWSTIQRKLEMLDKVKFENIVVHIGLTVSVLNILYIPEFIKWQLDSRFKKIRIFNSSFCMRILHVSEFHSIKHLPLYIKNEVRLKFNKYLKEINTKSIDSYFSNSVKLEIERSLQVIIDYMYFEEGNPKIFKYFLDTTSKLDKLRGIEISDYLSELACTLGISKLE